jgi:hypothetical protein
LAFVGLALLGIFDLDWAFKKPSGGGGTLANGISSPDDPQPVITAVQATNISAAQSRLKTRFILIGRPRARRAPSVGGRS